MHYCPISIENIKRKTERKKKRQKQKRKKKLNDVIQLMLFRNACELSQLLK